MKHLLQAHGIKVINNQISKADVEKAVEIIATAGKSRSKEVEEILSKEGFVKMSENAESFRLRDIGDACDRLEDLESILKERTSTKVVTADCISDMDNIVKEMIKEDKKIKGIFIEKDYDIGVFSTIDLIYGKHKIKLSTSSCDIDYPQDNGEIDEIIEGFSKNIRSNIKKFLKILSKRETYLWTELVNNKAMFN